MTFYVKFKNGEDFTVYCPNMEEAFVEDIMDTSVKFNISLSGYFNGSSLISSTIFNTSEVLYISQTPDNQEAIEK